MCDSYTPSLSVSVRSIVAPGYFAFTAASTLVLVVPVSGVSRGRLGCSWAPEVELGVGEGVVVAALAARVPAATAPMMAPPARSTAGRPRA